MRLLYLALTLSMYLPVLLNAQQITRLEAPVDLGQGPLTFPWAGGLNNPQYSNIDLNGDGAQDLFIFDRNGAAQLTFLHTGAAGTLSYAFAPEYVAAFPKPLEWALLRDFNGDGIPDMFANAYDQPPQGVIVYRGSQIDNQLQFDRMNFDQPFNMLYFQLPGSGESQLYCSSEDIPAIDDIDNDGDLDILAFEPNGVNVYWYKNVSVEDGFGLDTLLYEVGDLCWGQFEESGLSAEILLAPSPSDCGSGLQGEQVFPKHAGSTLLTLDLDGDLDREILLGDLFNNHLTMLTNGGTPGDAWMTEVETNFPAYDQPVDISVFNAAFYVDVDHDGQKDLIAAPNAQGGNEDISCNWLYRNIGTADQPLFEYERDDFLVGEMIDLGTGAHPAFVDYNADGLLDLVVGNQNRFDSTGNRDAQLILLENTGTANQPAFTLVDDDWLSFSQFNDDNRYEFVPTFGDLDNDGDADLLVGENSGRFYFLENTAGPGKPVAFNSSQAVFPYMDIDVINSPVPQLIDLNRDGLLDLVAGMRNGFIVYFQNQGSAQSPFFDNDPASFPNTLKLGNVDTREDNTPTRGFAAPFFIEIDGKYELLCGSFRGGIKRYSGVEDSLYGTFTKVNDRVGNLYEGEKVHLFLADINADNLLDMVVGNSRGGLGLFQTDLMTTPTSTHFVSPQTTYLELYPNPAKEALQVYFPDIPSEGVLWRLYDQTGRLQQQGQWQNARSTIDLRRLPAGIYLLQVQHSAGTAVRKVIKH